MFSAAFFQALHCARQRTDAESLLQGNALKGAAIILDPGLDNEWTEMTQHTWPTWVDDTVFFVWFPQPSRYGRCFGAGFLRRA